MTGPNDPQQIQNEIREKLNRVERFLDRNEGGALLLSRNANIAWITAGQVEARVRLSGDTAVCSLLLTRDGRRYYLAPNNEGPRLADEEFAGLGYEAVLYPWHEGPGNLIRELMAGAALLADTSHPDAKLVSLTDMQAPLLPCEIDRFRIVARETAAATVEVLEGLAPGVSEREMAARTASALLVCGVAPTVLLMGVDDRIHRYKHAVPRAGILQRYGMVNLCARRWGLTVSITRFVYFGQPPADLVAAFTAAAQIHAHLLRATREGVASSEIFAAAKRAYAAVGAADEIERHHQGGACGYAERDWIITPRGEERVTAPQAFAYNPSLRGAKAEDTVVLAGNKIEILTETPTIPKIETVLDGVTYHSAGVLLRQ